MCSELGSFWVDRRASNMAKRSKKLGRHFMGANKLDPVRGAKEQDSPRQTKIAEAPGCLAQ
jgi:hypothetical protein